MKPKLGLEVFDLPIQKIRNGCLADVYFWREKRILENEKRNPDILMQIFQKNKGILAGIDEAVAILRIGTGYYTDYKHSTILFEELRHLEREICKIKALKKRKEFLSLWNLYFDTENRLNDLWVDKFDALTIKSLEDGDEISPWETVMTINGRCSYFAHLESLYLGVLSRGTRIASNTKKVVDAANGKPVLFMGSRFDHYSTQKSDGYAAILAGASDVSTDAQGERSGKKGKGTMPHALIAAYNGDTAKATIAFAQNYPGVRKISLVDFHNNCPKTAVEVARAMEKEGIELHGVRLDTSSTMVDGSVISVMGKFKPTGVCEQVVENTRKALDEAGFSNVEIIVSGGFNEEKIMRFEDAEITIGLYGVGSSILKGNYDFTADIVVVNGEKLAKKGREHNLNSRLTMVEI